jgi:hypothetical protein
MSSLTFTYGLPMMVVQVRRVDPTTTALIENAILICKPREASVRKVRTLSPISNLPP